MATNKKQYTPSSSLPCLFPAEFEQPHVRDSARACG
jgi:hypothetical protein